MNGVTLKTSKRKGELSNWTRRCAVGRDKITNNGYNLGGIGLYAVETNRATKSCAKRFSEEPEAVTEPACIQFA